MDDWTRALQERDQLIAECERLIREISRKGPFLKLLRAARDGLLLYVNYKANRTDRWQRTDETQIKSNSTPELVSADVSDRKQSDLPRSNCPSSRATARAGDTPRHPMGTNKQRPTGQNISRSPATRPLAHTPKTLEK